MYSQHERGKQDRMANGIESMDLDDVNVNVNVNRGFKLI